MADDLNKAGDVEVDLDAPNDDLDATMRAAVAAVEEIEAGTRLDKDDKPGSGGDEGELGRLRREIADLRDRSMRTLADFDNFRKRAEREKEETRKYALSEPLREFLGVADNLERALQAGGSADDLKRGVEMILRLMQDTLRRLGLREVGNPGEPFDPAVHEAVSREEGADVRSPVVSHVMLKGYFLHDRLLRPAMVRVTVPREGAAEAG
jgi:molecular chaperone GrpE